VKLIGTFSLGGGINLDISAEHNKVEVNVKLMSNSVIKKQISPDEAEKLNALLDWAIAEAKKP
jgi:hypothetical protein